MCTTKQKIELIEKHFEKALAPENMKDEMFTVKPHPMTDKFTENEVKKAAESIKNGKSCGIDKCNSEFIKYAPSQIHTRIANIFNKIAETGEDIEHLTLGLLTPLPKPEKPKGPPENLRPVILLSILRKILTISLLNRIWERLEKEITKEQAAYQGGRSTSEQVLALKLIVEKAITHTDLQIHIKLLDMSKAFDTVNRKILLKDLEQILNKDELHLLSKITNKPKLKVKLEGQQGQAFQTYQGIMQGDCLSAVLFIYYLSCALKEEQISLNDHNYAKPIHMNINPKYADDITYITDNKKTHDNREEITTKRLQEYNLGVNRTKTENYEVPENQHPEPVPPGDDGKKILWSDLDWLVPSKENRNRNKKWKECKLLGSKLDTEKDIQHRKTKTVLAMKNQKHIFRSKVTSFIIKITSSQVFFV